MNPLTEDGSRGDEERGRARGRTKRERKSEFRPTSAPLQLSEEEKAVLMDCRRNSIARGVVVTASSVLLLRALIGTGRVPLHVQRWSSMYYTSVGAVAFLMGMRSYRQQCFDKIMALENSVLAAQVRQHQRRQQGWTDEDAVLPPPHLPTSTPSQPLPPVTTVPSDQHFSSTVVEESVSDQPDAFASIAPTDPGGIPGVYESAPLKTRGRTFDEIRDENRRRHQQKRYPESARGGLRGEDAGKPVHVRRNKYGDIVSED